MKQVFSVRQGALVGAAVAAALIAIPVSSASASGTYVSTSGTSLLGVTLPSISTTLPVSSPSLDFNVVESVNLGSSLSLATLNLDPHMVK